MDCDADPACSCVAACIAQGGDSCEADCAVPTPFPLYDALIACVLMQCPVCEPDCNPAGDAPACTLCVAQPCCYELDLCLGTPPCACMEACLATGATPFDMCATMCGPGDFSELDALRACAEANECFVRPDIPCYAQ